MRVSAATRVPNEFRQSLPSQRTLWLGWVDFGCQGDTPSECQVEAVGGSGRFVSRASRVPMNLFRMRPSYRRAAGPLALLLATGVLSVLSSGAAVAAQRPLPVDALSSYQPQTTCRKTPLPGTVYLLHWLQRHYPHPGFSSMMRPCDTPGVTEHKDGRALDWGTDVTVPSQKAQAQAFLDRIFASDRHGNPDALARRMGIMYVIWDDHIYGAYTDPPFLKRDYLASGCKTAAKCSPTLQHRDHIHISLSYAGASAQTSFYRARNVASVPVLYPGTRRLDPVQTAVATVQVPADGSAVSTSFKVTRGVTYEIVGDGLYRFGPGSDIGDAACVWHADGWVPSGSGLLVNGHSPWTADSCSGGHTHVASYTAHRTGRLQLSIGDPSPSNNAGTLTFSIVRPDIAPSSLAAAPPVAGPEPQPARHAGPSARRLRDETVTVSASRRRGALTERALRPGASYRLVVSGVAQSGDVAFDGKCVDYHGHYGPNYTMDLSQPAADHLSLFVAGVKVPLHVPGSKRACSPAHRYVGRFTAPVAGRAHVRVWDPFDYSDNTGALQVRLTSLG